MGSYRLDHDSIGDYKVPQKALYGSQTRRSYDAIKVTSQRFSTKIIKNIILIKKIEILANWSNDLNNVRVNAVIAACEQLLKHFNKYKNHFITDKIQGGAGTSINMNVNEVLANLATKILVQNGSEGRIHPNDFVNVGQSTNDVFPSAAKITFYKEIDKLIAIIKKLKRSLFRNSKRFEMMRVGKTHLQDAVPIKMNSLFIAWANALDRSLQNLTACLNNFLELNLGGTAIGTGIAQNKETIAKLYHLLKAETGKSFRPAPDLIDNTRHLDVFLDASNALKSFITILSKNCNDLRLLASGPSVGFKEILLPQIQPGSSIIPGKINPVIPETINQIAFSIYGHNTTISFAVEAGQLELNVFEPIIFSTLLESIRYAQRGCVMLIAKMLNSIEPNITSINNNLENSHVFTTLFAKKYGYARISQIVLNATKNNENIKDQLMQKLNITDQDYETIIQEKDVFPIGDQHE